MVVPIVCLGVSLFGTAFREETFVFLTWESDFWREDISVEGGVGDFLGLGILLGGCGKSSFLSSWLVLCFRYDLALTDDGGLRNAT